MQKRQLYASLEIAEDEIRLLVGEFFMSRLNVIKVDTIKCSGIKNRYIEKPQVVSATIVKLIKNTENALGFKIKKMILVIPSIGVKCIKRKVSVAIEEGARKILMSHVRLGLEKAIDYETSDALEFVNVGSVKYIVGGISSRKIPLEERSDLLGMEIDLLYAKKELLYSYVACVEQAGVSILDICLDTYAIAEESAVLENSMDKYVVLVSLDKSTTTLSLYYKGSLLECDTQNLGYNNWVNALREKYHLSTNECLSLVKDNSFAEDGLYDDRIAYMWLDREEHHQLSKKEINDAIKEKVNQWFSAINSTCEPIAELGDCCLILTGDGADIVGFESTLEKFSIPAQMYIPTTIGTRKGCWSACLGSLYCTKKRQSIKNVSEVSIEYNNLIAREQQREDENAFTKKLKNILLVNK